MLKHQMEKFKETKVGKFVANHEKAIKRAALISGIVVGAVLAKKGSDAKKANVMKLTVHWRNNEDTPALESPREEIALDEHSESVIEEPAVTEPNIENENVNND